MLVPLGFSASVPGFPAICPSPATNGFTGCYYSNTTLSGDPAFIRTDPQINFYWGNKSPDPSLPPLDFSVRWQGNFSLPAGTYVFNAVTSDGMRLYIDGNLILDKWRDQAPTGYNATASLNQGMHLITVEYYEVLGGATAQVSWQNTTPPTSAAPVISSFTATPAAASPGQPVVLSWSVSGATSIALDNGIGDVTTSSQVTVWPGQTTVYTLTASNTTGITTNAVTVAVQSSPGGPVPDIQPPTAPTLTSAVAVSATEIDLAWTASTDNVGVAGYQIMRNGTIVGSVTGATLSYADASATPNSTYIYAVMAYDAAKSYSPASNSIQVLTPAPATSSNTCPGPATNAFTGCYYGNTTLSGDPAFIRTDPQINFYWGNKSPDPSLAPLDFSVRWQGNFTFGSGTYTFTAVTSDGMRLYIDGNVIINQWRDQPAYSYIATPSLSQGTHLVTVEYYERQGGAIAQVSWQNAAPATPAAPVISSFTATPASGSPGQPVVLSWSVSGATSIAIDNGIGNVTTSSQVTVWPAQTTIYTLAASNSTDTTIATVQVTVQTSGATPDNQPPTAPTLTSAVAAGATEVDLVWTASTDNVGVAGYQINRNGTAIASVAGATLNYADTTVNANATYVYAVMAYDAAKNYSASSNSLLVSTPAAGTSSVSVNWIGGCWQPLTINGVSGNFQAIDFILTTANPAPVQGTLFFTPNCDPSQGTDNMNDFNTLTGSSHMIRGFTHFPDVTPTSAYYWVGPLTADGKCAPGAPCSGCVTYTKTTPLCSALP